MSSIAFVLGINLARRRILKGFTQVQFAKITGFARSTIARYESGEAGFDAKTISIFAKALNVEETDLVALPKSILPGKEFPNEFVEFIREARKNEQFYKDFMENLANKMDTQSKTMRKLMAKEGYNIFPDDLVASELAKVPEFTFPSYPSITDELLEQLADPDVAEVASRFAALNKGQREIFLIRLRGAGGKSSDSEKKKAK